MVMRDLEREPPSEGRVETTKGCGETADWYDDKQGDEGDLWRRTLTDPTLLQVLGDVA